MNEGRYHRQSVNRPRRLSVGSFNKRPLFAKYAAFGRNDQSVEIDPHVLRLLKKLSGNKRYPVMLESRKRVGDFTKMAPDNHKELQKPLSFNLCKTS